MMIIDNRLPQNSRNSFVDQHKKLAKKKLPLLKAEMLFFDLKSVQLIAASISFS